MRAGRIVRPDGLDGSFHVSSPGELAAGGTVFVDGAARTVERVAGTPERPIIRLSVCPPRVEAEVLRGSWLRVPRGALEEGEYWAGDLEGFTVVDGAREVGVVSRMVALPSCEALEVGDLLIPMVRDAIRSIDLDARRIDVDLGFLG